MRRGEKINLGLSILISFIFLFSGIRELLIQIPSYKETQLLLASGAHCIGDCSFWDFFLWPTVFILIGIGMIIFMIVWYHQITRRDK